MSDYDDFDLDVKNISNEKASAAYTSPVCSAILSSVVTGCTGNCITTNCQTSGNSCPCHGSTNGVRAC